MTGNPFDRAARYAAKLDPPGFLAWVLSLPGDAFAFGGWLDTRGVSFPGDSDRTGDTVARLDRPGGTDPPWAVAVEFQIEPDPLMFGRLVLYLGNLWASVKPDEGRGSRFEVGAVVVNLTGSGRASRRMEWPAAGLVTHLSAAERNLSGENADEILAGVEGAARSRALLPWVPLMTGGGEAGIIDRWKAAAESEPNYHRRVDLAWLARVFADAADRKPIWDKALEGWNVKESATVKEWIAEGKAEGALAEAAAAVVAVLEARFGSAPGDLIEAVRRSTDLAVLRNWVALAARTPTLADFRAAANL